MIDDLTAVVTVADNGGSSGRLRERVRRAPARRPADGAGGAVRRRRLGPDLGATCCSTGSPATASCSGHALGNLLIVALWELLGDHVAGLDWVGRLLGAHGRVLPMAAVPLDITAEVRGLDPADPAVRTIVRGQVAGGAAPRARSSRSQLEPDDPPACPEVGRGRSGPPTGSSWGRARGSPRVIPHLLVPELARRARARPGPRRLVDAQPRAAGRRDRRASAPQTTSRCCAEHAPDLTVDVVLADPSGSRRRAARPAAAGRRASARPAARRGRSTARRDATRRAGDALRCAAALR